MTDKFEKYIERNKVNNERAKKMKCLKEKVGSMSPHKLMLFNAGHIKNNSHITELQEKHKYLREDPVFKALVGMYSELDKENEKGNLRQEDNFYFHGRVMNKLNSLANDITNRTMNELNYRAMLRLIHPDYVEANHC